MSLESGKYRVHTQDGAPVGRRPFENLDLFPKGIFKLPKHAPVPGHEALNEEWEVEKLDNGNYKFKVVGAPVGSFDGLLYAFLRQEQVQATEWKIIPKEHDQDVYLVENVSIEGKGWKAQGPEEQIAVATLIAFQTYPPTYPPNELFVFKKAD